MKLTIALQNLSHGGKRINDDDSQDRWPRLVERLRAAAPDLCILNEATGWDTPGNTDAGEHHWPVAAAHAAELDLAVAVVTPTKTAVPTAILYREAVLGAPRARDVKHRDLFYNGGGVAVWDVPGLTEPLAVGGVHITPFAREIALIETQAIACRVYRHSQIGVVAGDFNFSPAWGEDPDIDAMLPHNKALRLEDPLDPDSKPWRAVGERLREFGFHDVAAALHHDRLEAEGINDRNLLAYTGIDERIDWIAVTEPLRATISDYRVLDTPAGASDHLGVLAVLDLAKFDATAALPGYR